MSFVHLHTHTQYSLLDGSNKITEYVKRVKELGMNAAAITDHGAMYGVTHFYEECKAQGIKPIIGCEVYVAPESRFDRENGAGEDRYSHLVLLAENNEGYKNLMKIVSKGFTEGFYYKPRVDKEVLRKYHNGIIASSACLAGEVAKCLCENRYEDAKKIALEYQEIFGKDNYFLEIQDHGIPLQKTVIQGVLRLHKETGIDIIATNDIHYTYKEDVESHDILLCIQTGKLVSDEDRMRYEGGQYYVKSEEEMRELFPYASEAIENTQKIADRCNVEIEFGVTKLPKFQVPENMSAWEYLNKLCYAGLQKRYDKYWEENNSVNANELDKSNQKEILKYKKETLEERLKYELETIHTMGFVDYFLIVSDFISYARSKGIPVGPGRGSAAGSIVSYTLGITNIDPIRYDLLFERFLNPERVSMPDIDVDFCYERRSEVIDYVSKKYGEECVVQIVTFGTLQAKGVIRDVTRVLDKPYQFGDRLARMIPSELNMTLEKALAKNPEFRLEYDSDPETKKIINICKALEGLPRHTSKHAAGVLITDRSVDEYVPLSKSPDGAIVAQFDMVTLERLGLLKMDFLGLRTLTVLNDCVKHIKKLHGIDIDIDNIDWNDKGVYDMLSLAKTDGVFQLESGGMKSFMKKLKPKSMEEVIAGISLFRPGPMDFIPKYIKGKENENSVDYDCPELEPILKSTYGCIVYQEQVMRIVRELGGFSMGRSDNLRRAMSKKKAKVMQSERQAFLYGDENEGVSGCIKRGIPEDIGNKIYDEMISFAAYAFNKSHAAAYAIVAYQTAYLKYYYPVEFMAALMTSVIENNVKLKGYINVTKAMGIEILPPDVNSGDTAFVPIKKEDGSLAIRYALSAVKGIGSAVTDFIVEDRNQKGIYESFEEFVNRTEMHLSQSGIENFIKAGALDSLGLNRRQKVYMIPMLIKKAKKNRKESMSGQYSLLDLAVGVDRKQFEIAIPNVEEYPKKEILEYEKETLGGYLSGHPLEDFEDLLNKNVTAHAVDFYYDETEQKTNVKDKQQVIVGGMITEVISRYTKKDNRAMAQIVIEDLSGEIECVAFPNVFEKIRDQLFEDNKVIIRGSVAEQDEKNAQLFISEMYTMDTKSNTLWVKIENMEAFENKKDIFDDLIYLKSGVDKVCIYLSEEKKIREMTANRKVKLTDEFIEKIEETFGIENVEIKEAAIELNIKIR